MNRFATNTPYYKDNNIYDDLNRIKNMSLQLPVYRTVFTDIADE